MCEYFLKDCYDQLKLLKSTKQIFIDSYLFIGTSIEVESTSTLHNSSPIQDRRFKLNRHILHVPDMGSKLTINSTFGSQVIDPSEMENRRGLRPRRVLSSIASSSDEHSKSQGMLNKIRESKSLDPLPLIKKPPEPANKYLNPNKRSTKSLENCDKCGDIQIITLPNSKLNNNNFPNGNIINLSNEDNTLSMEEVEVPLLQSNINPVIHRRRRGSSNDEGTEEQSSKRWRSLESVPAACDQISDDQQKKIMPRHSIKSWIVGLFNGNGVKNSNTSLRKGVLDEFNNLQTEKESIV